MLLVGCCRSWHLTGYCFNCMAWLQRHTAVCSCQVARSAAARWQPDTTCAGLHSSSENALSLRLVITSISKSKLLNPSPTRPALCHPNDCQVTTSTAYPSFGFSTVLVCSASLSQIKRFIKTGAAFSHTSSSKCFCQPTI